MVNNRLRTSTIAAALRGKSFVDHNHDDIYQRPDSVAITGGSINGTTIGSTTPSSGVFTSLSATGHVGFSSTPTVGLTNLALADGSNAVSPTPWNISITGNAGTTTAVNAEMLCNITPSTFGLSLLDDADAATARSTLGLGTIATQAASSVAVTGGSINGTTIGGTTAAAGTFTSLTATGTVGFSSTPRVGLTNLALADGSNATGPGWGISITGSSGSCTGSAGSTGTAVVSNVDSSSAYRYLLLSASSSDGTSNVIQVASGVYCKPSESKLYASTFVGDVTGNVSGSSGSCTGNAASATNSSKLGNVTPSTFGLSLLDDADAATARSTLGVSYGASAGTVCQGNDSRLSDSRTPTSHNQAWSTITGTPTTLSGYGISDAVASGSNYVNIGVASAMDITGRNLTAISDAGFNSSVSSIANQSTGFNSFFTGQPRAGYGNVYIQSANASSVYICTNTTSTDNIGFGVLHTSGSGNYVTVRCSSGDPIISTNSGNIMFGRDITPTSSGGANLGSSSAPWGAVYGSTFSGTAGNSSKLGNVTPSTFGLSLLDDADAATARSTLGLGTIATQAASSVAVTGGSINGTTIGETTAAAGTFTSLTATGTVGFSSTPRVGLTNLALADGSNATGPGWGISITGSSGSCTGAAGSTGTAVVSNVDSSSAYRYLLLSASSSNGTSNVIQVASGVYCKPSESKLYASTFVGDVTGNVTGSSGSCTGTASNANTLGSASPDTAATANTIVKRDNFGYAQAVRMYADDGFYYNGTPVAKNNGSNATGTWGISITGSSGSCTGNAASATNATTLGGRSSDIYDNANTIVLRTSDGSIYANNIDANSASLTSVSCGSVTCQEVGLGTITGQSNAIVLRTNSSSRALNLGHVASATEYMTIYGSSIYGNPYFGSTTNQIQINANFIPLSDNTRILGWSSLRWSRVYAAYGSIDTSDEREKENIHQIDSALAGEFFDLVGPLEFYHKGQKELSWGFSAQQVDRALEKTFGRRAVLDKENPEIWGLNYSHFTPILWSVVKDLKNEVAYLKARIGEV